MTNQRMSKIKSSNTRPELIVRSLLHRAGYRFRINVKGMPGSPDIVMRRHGTVIFIHGCFWHRHQGCKFAQLPSTNLEFWRHKFESNIKRDEKVQDLLKSQGWRVLVVWECEIKKSDFPLKLLSFFSLHSINVSIY